MVRLSFCRTICLTGALLLAPIGDGSATETTDLSLSQPANSHAQKLILPRPKPLVLGLQERKDLTTIEDEQEHIRYLKDARLPPFARDAALMRYSPEQLRSLPISILNIIRSNGDVTLEHKELKSAHRVIRKVRYGKKNRRGKRKRYVVYKKVKSHNIIEVSVKDRKLAYQFSPNQVLTFPVATARPGIQYYGRTHITRKRREPTWIPTRNQRRLYKNLPSRVLPGPDNPLGSRALNLARKNLRIHGTNEPDTIGQAVSDGCIRMRNEHINVLFPMIKVGTLVTIKR